MIPPKVRAVVFDAIGTMLVPAQPVPVIYTRAGERLGSRLTQAMVSQRFRIAFQHEETVDTLAGLRTSEQRERERWRRIVAHVLDDVSDKEACFLDLFNHFGRADTWRCPEDAQSTMRELAARGYQLGIASNWDARLRQVAAGKPELQGLHHLIISSEVGWRKPSSHFFGAVAAAFQLAPEQILFIGDDPVNDYGGARVAGMKALLLDPAGGQIYPVKPCIPRLSDLLGSGTTAA